jgi:hypothetical protein
MLLLLLSALSKTEHWTDVVDVNQNTGVIIDRTVKLEFTGGELSDFGTRWPTTYELATTNPLNKKTIEWSGPYGLNPIFIGFTPTKTYLVALPMRCDAKIESFSAPKLPYIFQETSDGMQWKVISPEAFPSEFNQANLSATYRSSWMRGGKRQFPQEIRDRNSSTERASVNFFSVKFPRDYEQWSYKHKDPKGYTGC